MELIIFIWGVGMLLQEEKGEKIRKNERMDMISEIQVDTGFIAGCKQNFKNIFQDLIFLL